MFKALSVILLFHALLCSQFYARAQNEYLMNLPEPAKKIIPSHYFIQSVLDRRKIPENYGKILSPAGKAMSVKFKHRLDTVILNYSTRAINLDTTMVPVHITLEKLNFTDIGNVTKHTLTLAVKLSIIRIIEGKEMVLYGTNGTPSFNSRGVTSGLAEKLMQQSIDALLLGFEEYANSNPDQQAFCKNTQIEFIYDSSYTNYTDSDTIRWKKDLKLTWDDFQGKADPSSSFSAQSNCMFSYKSKAEYISGVMKLSLYLYPCFTKRASWVVPKNKQESLLNHEQLHFDICELYIRKLRKQISSLTLTLLDPGEQIKREFELAWADYQKAQSLYDIETRHGIIEITQKQWETDVKNQLEDLNEYSTQ